MPSTLYLAMTAAEIDTNFSLPSKLAWMACHFSPYGTGLSNLPQALPEGSMLIVNDRTPVGSHSPEGIVSQLHELLENFGCSHVLLDFQRPGQPQTERIARAIAENLSCPVGVSEPYAKDLPGPVFLPPVPLWMSAEEYLTPWTGREIWLEAALDAATITVTPAGSSFSPCPAPEAALPHRDATLCCHYGTQLSEDSACFTLHRTWDDLQAQMEQCPDALFVGLYQELRPYC